MESRDVISNQVLEKTDACVGDGVDLLDGSSWLAACKGQNIYWS